ncbi:MAG: hypothetical protein C0507_02750 [Cyanobacteria bacterium PR.3.49]|nr:hypothetical protein [Cyanobacteria bacterium PR.3.49]
MNLKTRRPGAAALASILFCATLSGLYVLSILWRVSVAEHEVMGKDLMLHIFTSRKEFDKPQTIDSYMAATFSQNYKNMRFDVWRDKINGFQHTYGSALAAFELGDYLSDKLFVANEFTEWFFDKDGVSERDLRDRHRDLENNRIGRGIARQAHQIGYFGHDAEEYMRDRIVLAIENERSVITHWMDPKVDLLPTEADMGCPNLPKINGYDCYRTARQKIKKTKQRIARKIHKYWNKVEALVT